MYPDWLAHLGFSTIKSVSVTFKLQLSPPIMVISLKPLSSQKYSVPPPDVLWLNVNPDFKVIIRKNPKKRFLCNIL